MRILSLKEKAGKKIEFSEGVNIIQGNNDTGKSSLLKSIYYTFGADPSMHPIWDSANPISIIDFEYDSKKYTIMRNKSTIFDLKTSFTRQLVKIIMSKTEIMGTNKISKEISSLDTLAKRVLQQNKLR